MKEIEDAELTKHPVQGIEYEVLSEKVRVLSKDITAKDIMKTKTATCWKEVPAVLSPTGKVIKVGDTVQYKRIDFWNGEGHLELADGWDVPDTFFNSEVDDVIHPFKQFVLALTGIYLLIVIYALSDGVIQHPHVLGWFAWIFIVVNGVTFDRIAIDHFYYRSLKK